LQRDLGNPAELGARVDEQGGHRHDPSGLADVDDLAIDVEGTQATSRQCAERVVLPRPLDNRSGSTGPGRLRAWYLWPAEWTRSSSPCRDSPDFCRPGISAVAFRSGHRPADSPRERPAGPGPNRSQTPAPEAPHAPSPGSTALDPAPRTL